VEKKQVIGNVVNLDIRTATEASIANIKSIGNVVNLLYSPETAALIGRLNVGNIVNPMEVPADAKLHRGQLVLNRETFKGQAAPLRMAVMGQLTVEPDLSPEDIERGIDYLGVFGHVLCPEHLARAIEAKLKYLHGPMHVYPRDCKPVVGSLTLDERFLGSLDDGSKLMVTGKLNAKDVLPNELLQRKVAKIVVADGVACRAENAEVLLARLERKSGADKVTVIPAGYEMVERALVLNAALLEALPVRKLYCTEVVRVEEDVTPEALDKSLEALVVKEMLICPVALEGVMAKKLDILETEAIFYEGKLWLVDGKATLSTARLGYLEGETTLIVTGKLKIEPDIAPKTLVERLIVVHNLGQIVGSAEQIAALEFRLGINEGDLKAVSPEKAAEEPEPEGPKEDTEYVINNIVNMKL
jgi:hypothetical protein